MTAYQPKTYQNSVLESVETYFRACHELPNPRMTYRLIGGLWAELSGGRCRFVMVTNRQWDGIDALL